MRHILLILAILTASTAYCQTDSSALGKYKKSTYIGFRSETGWNRSWFKSIGVSYLHANVNMHAPSFIVAYLAADINLATYEQPTTSFYSYKGGVEFGNVFLMGIEVRGYTDFKGKEHTVFMPKAGISAFGALNLTYGYNVYQIHNNIFGVGRHQIAFSANISRKFFTESFLPE